MKKYKKIYTSPVGASNFLPKEQMIHLDAPKPSKAYIPEWYKKSPMFSKGSYNPNTDPLPTLAYKACAPFLDSMTSGYTITTWCDITFSYGPEPYDQLDDDQKDNPNFYWSMSPEPIGKRDTEVMQLFPVPEGFSKTPYVWQQPWALKTPPGYSLLYTHPYNRFDLPFITLSGIVDSDNFFAGGNIPFYLKKGFTGIIKSGTPIIQVIPIKREKWEIDESIDLYEESNRIGSKARSVISGYYKQHFWKKKDYR